MKKSILTSLIPTVIMLSVLCLTACKTVQTATDTTQNHTATDIRRDSIFVHDSVYVRIRADTVYLEKWHTRWRDRETIRADTITNEVVRTDTVQVRYIPRFYKYCTALAILLLLLMLAKFMLLLYKRLY